MPHPTGIQPKLLLEAKLILSEGGLQIETEPATQPLRLAYWMGSTSYAHFRYASGVVIDYLFAEYLDADTAFFKHGVHIATLRFWEDGRVVCTSQVLPQHLRRYAIGEHARRVTTSYQSGVAYTWEMQDWGRGKVLGTLVVSLPPSSKQEEE